jgi:hypothetical protein
MSDKVHNRLYPDHDSPNEFDGLTELICKEGSVNLSVMDWHNLLKMVEHSLQVANYSRLTGLTNHMVEQLYVKIASQLQDIEIPGKEQGSQCCSECVCSDSR